MEKILHRFDTEHEHGFTFWCEGCKQAHNVWVEPSRVTWGWNGSLDKPTFDPSILVQGTQPLTDEQVELIMSGTKIDPVEFRCHSYIRDGVMEYLMDCSHSMAGQKVPLKEFSI